MMNSLFPFYCFFVVREGSLVAFTNPGLDGASGDENGRGM